MRRQRTWSEVANDPRTSYMIGRLLGANEMAAALLAREDNEVAREVAAKLESVIAYFLVEDVKVLTLRRDPPD